jgi:hypothetical protein
MDTMRPLSSRRGFALAVLAALAPASTHAQTPAWTIDPSTIEVFGPAYEAVPFGPYGYTYVRSLHDGGLLTVRGERYEVTILDAQGRVERTLSAWPGSQLGYITGIAAGSGDTILVYDVPTTGTLRRTRFLRNGRHVDSERVGVTDGLGAIYQGALTDGTVVGVWTKLTPIDPSFETSDSNRIGLFRGDTVPNVVARLTGIRRRGSPVHFSPHPIVAVVADTIFYSNGVDGLIDAVLANGSAVRSFRAPIEPLSLDEAYSRLAPRLSDPGLHPDVASFNRGTVVPTISDILPGPDGHLWVRPYDPATDSHSLGRPRSGGEWLVVDTDGRVEARVAVPNGFRLMEIAGDRVAGILRDEAGERAVTFSLARVRPRA